MDIVQFLDKFNWQTIIGMFVISWYFTHDIKAALERQAAVSDKLSERTDKLYQMFIDLIKEGRK